jgi:magnesium transporter
MLKEMQSADIAEMFEEVEKKDCLIMLKMMDKEEAAEVLSYLSINKQREIVEGVFDKQLQEIINEMAFDDKLDLINEMPSNFVRKILQFTPAHERNLINHFLNYPEDSMGGIMTIEYVEVKKNFTVKDALDYIRKTGLDKETIYNCYVIDDKRKLEGVVSLRKLLFSPDDSKIEEIMDNNVVYGITSENQEEAIKKFKKYDLISLPVVDSEGRLVGIITIDDVIDAMDVEHTEDLQKFMGFTGEPEREDYLNTSVFQQFKRRAVWVVSLAALGLVSGYIIHSYESYLETLIILALYIPMLADTGGNVGSQAATIVVRALALDEISYTDYFKVLFKELRISLLLSIPVGMVAFGRILFLSSGVELPPGFTFLRVALTITIALSIQVVTSTCIGASLPLLAKKLNQDPAVMSSPALTTMVDITGLMIYFTTARLILGL